VSRTQFDFDNIEVATVTGSRELTQKPAHRSTARHRAFNAAKARLLEYLDQRDTPANRMRRLQRHLGKTCHAGA
jgi:hypothetical protein